LLDEGRGWKDRVKEKGETLFQEKKRAAIRAACYKDWWVHEQERIVNEQPL
jgi:hypothetical protein